LRVSEIVLSARLTAILAISWGLRWALSVFVTKMKGERRKRGIRKRVCIWVLDGAMRSFAASVKETTERG
jgi:hypothetical protein